MDGVDNEGAFTVVISLKYLENTRVHNTSGLGWGTTIGRRASQIKSWVTDTRHRLPVGVKV